MECVSQTRHWLLPYTPCTAWATPVHVLLSWYLSFTSILSLFTRDNITILHLFMCGDGLDTAGGGQWLPAGWCIMVHCRLELQLHIRISHAVMHCVFVTLSAALGSVVQLPCSLRVLFTSMYASFKDPGDNTCRKTTGTVTCLSQAQTCCVV